MRVRGKQSDIPFSRRDFARREVVERARGFDRSAGSGACHAWSRNGAWCHQPTAVLQNEASERAEGQCDSAQPGATRRNLAQPTGRFCKTKPPLSADPTESSKTRQNLTSTRGNEKRTQRHFQARARGCAACRVKKQSQTKRSLTRVFARPTRKCSGMFARSRAAHYETNPLR